MNAYILLLLRVFKSTYLHCFIVLMVKISILCCFCKPLWKTTAGTYNHVWRMIESQIIETKLCVGLNRFKLVHVCWAALPLQVFIIITFTDFIFLPSISSISSANRFTSSSPFTSSIATTPSTSLYFFNKDTIGSSVKACDISWS